MRTILVLVQKEFRQILRDKFMGKAIIVLPIVQMVILVYAATFEIKNIDILIVDRDGSSSSVKLTQKFLGSNFFTIDKGFFTNKQVADYLDNGKADLALIPSKKVKDNWDKIVWDMDTLTCVKEDSNRNRKKYVFKSKSSND